MKRMYLICNAHIDPMWQWEWTEGVGTALSTFRVAAELCEKNDAFVFNHNESLLYQWIEEYEPELFRRIEALVRKGRWHIMGGWFVQPDCNIPHGESIVRQISTGRRYFREKFGAEPTTAINFDPFGHSRGIVQIMAKSGYDSYIICRPFHPVPGADRFVWKGFAGSEVRVLWMPGLYNSPLGQADKRILDVMERQIGEENGAVLWGVGNHGGGPSRVDLEKIGAMMEASGDVAFMHATPEEFFAACGEEDWPVYEKSLHHTMVGCYSSQVRIKQQHRRLENELLAAEKMLACAQVQGLAEYPEKELDTAWKDLMFAQFHDVLPGSSIQPVEEGGLRLLGHGLMEAERMRIKAFFRLSAGQTPARDGEIPVLIYNPHPYEVETDIVCEFMLADQYLGDQVVDILVYDEAGRRLDSQVEKEYSNIPINWRKRVAFRGTLAPSGMTRFNLRSELLPQPPAQAIAADADCFCFSGRGYTARLNRKSGLLESYAVGGKEYLSAPSGEVLVIQDIEDSWGMYIQGFQNVTGSLRLATPEQTAEICALEVPALDAVHIIENGPVRTIAECVFTGPQGQAVIRYTFPKNDSAIGVHIRLITAAKNTMFKYSLETALQDAALYGKAPFGLDTLRSDGLECTAQDYALLHDGTHALSVSNTGTYALSAENGALRMTLLRTPAYCAHPIEGRRIMRQDRFGEHMDQGERQFGFQINASEAAARLERVNTESLLLNQPPMALSFFPQGAGEKPAAGCVLDNPVVELSSLKRAFDGNGYTVRLYNPDLKAQRVHVRMPAFGAEFETSLQPMEVQTYRVQGGGAEACAITE